MTTSPSIDPTAPHLPDLPSEITVKPVGRATNWLWKSYAPVRNYRLPGEFQITECADRDWPVVFAGGEGEFHVFRASRPTVERMIATIRTDILGPSAQKPKSRLLSPKPKQHRYPVGDDIVIAFEWGSWGIKKLHQGMAPERVSEHQLEMLANVLAHVLEHTKTP
ncbi:MAG: hypothetical protein QNJ09_08700 [Paracoccaceae bacterium]|nr:hypothetical protein [Paracoccaceae bacterium]